MKEVQGINFPGITPGRGIIKFTTPSETDKKVYELLTSREKLAALIAEGGIPKVLNNPNTIYEVLATYQNGVSVYLLEAPWNPSFGKWKVENGNPKLEKVKEETFNPCDLMPENKVSRSSPLLRRIDFRLKEGGKKDLTLLKQINPLTGETIRTFKLLVVSPGIVALGEELAEKYDFVKKAKDFPYAMVDERVKETDIVVLEPGIKGPPPVFRVSGDKVVCINYPGSYKPTSIEEFMAYLNDVKEGLQR